MQYIDSAPIVELKDILFLVSAFQVMSEDGSISFDQVCASFEQEIYSTLAIDSSNVKAVILAIANKIQEV